MAARRGPLGQLANIAAAGTDGVVTRTFGTSLLYSQWTSGVVEGASRWHGDDYRAYCGRRAPSYQGHPPGHLWRRLGRNGPGSRRLPH